MTTFAVAGKGGVGKTTITALLVGTIPGLKFVVDADPNANLNELLGVNVRKTIGNEREKIRKSESTTPRQEQLQLAINQCIIEGQDFDMLVMGTPEGQGCYCAANSILRDAIARLSKDYPYVIIDCAAGMEHISRLTVNDVDALLIVVNQSPRDIEAGLRIEGLTKELKVRVGAVHYIINRSTKLDSKLSKRLAGKIIGFVPEDEIIKKQDSLGRPLTEITDSRASDAMRRIVSRLGITI
ncbi:MAG: AAA family ATPase [archaeon]